jgi:HEAT repeat protein
LEELRRGIAVHADEECEAIAQALATHPEAVCLALPLLADTDTDTRWWGVRVLAAAGQAEAIPALLQMLVDRDDEVRGAAALALGHLQAAEAVGALAVLMVDGEGWLRQLAADGLALIGEPAVPTLAEALEDPRDGVRVRACYALSRIRSPHAAGPLFRALNDPNYLVHTYAHEALNRMGLLDVILVI